MSQKVIRIDSDKKPAQIRTTVCTEADHGVPDTNEEATKAISLSSYHKVCSESSKRSPAFTEGQVNKTQTPRSYGVRTLFHVKKCKLNPCLQRDNFSKKKNCISIKCRYWEKED